MKPVSWYKSLSGSKGRREAGCFLVEGARGVGQLLAHHRGQVIELLCAGGFDGGGPGDINAAGVPVRTISSANMKTISTSRTPQGVAAVVRMPEDVYTSNLPDLPAPPSDSRVLLLEDVQDPGNVGTLIRTAAAFGYCGVVMSGKCADPFSPKVVQSSAGSLPPLWIRRSGGYIDMAESLKSRGFKLIAAHLDGDCPRAVAGAGPHVLILGNEGAGISGALLDKCGIKIKIPILSSGAESLNVAVSGGIMMYVTTRLK